MDDEESVLVASPFAYVTPPMPPREEVGNAKTTKAMAKIVEEVGTPDSVIRKLFAMASSATDSIGSSPRLDQVGTVSKGRGRSMEADPYDESEENFRFPVATPSQVNSSVDSDNSSEGFARFSLSLMHGPISSESPPLSPTPVLRSGAAIAASLGNMTDPSEASSGSTLPPLLTNCENCGKQFISEKHLEDHSNFCRAGGSHSTATDIEPRESQMSIASSSVATFCARDEKFSESPALPLYIQRALDRGVTSISTERSDTPVPSIGQQLAPPPMSGATPVSPSIVSSPNDFRASLNEGAEDGFEDEISTFLECLKSDLGCPRSSTPVEELFSDRQKIWASRRQRNSPLPITKKPSENSLQVSSDEDDACTVLPISTRLKLVPVVDSNQLSSIGSATSSANSSGSLMLPPPGPVALCSPPPPLPGPLVSLTSNMSINSPIQERSSFEIEPSYISASFLNGVPSPVDSVSLPPSRGSPTFGGLSSRTSFESSVDGRLRTSLPAVITDSSVTLMRLSGAVASSVSSSVASLDNQRCPCKFCGRKFATSARLERHENVCEKVFGSRPRATSLDRSSVSSRYGDSTMIASATGACVSCKHCGRTFSHRDKLNRHEHICLSVFKPSRDRSLSSNSRSNISADTVVDKSVYRKMSSNRRIVSSELIWIPSAIQRGRKLIVETFCNALCNSVSELPRQVPPTVPRRNSQSFTASVLSSTSLVSSRDESTTSSRTSLEFQYNLLKEQIRNCSARLKQRQVEHTWRRDG